MLGKQGCGVAVGDYRLYSYRSNRAGSICFRCLVLSRLLIVDFLGIFCILGLLYPAMRRRRFYKRQ